MWVRGVRQGLGIYDGLVSAGCGMAKRGRETCVQARVVHNVVTPLMPFFS